MKRMEKWAAQHAMLREAAFVVSRREGPGALTRRGLAAALGASEATARRVLAHHTQLPTLAAAACEDRRRVAQRRADAVDRLLPGVGGVDVDVEVVWLRLRLAHATPPAVEDGTDLPSRYQLATRGYQVEPAVGSGRDAVARADTDTSTGTGNDTDTGTERVTPTPAAAAAAAERIAMAPYLDDHEAVTRANVTRLVGGREDLVEAVLALVDGLVLAVCTGRLSPDAARPVLLEHLARLGVPLDPPSA